MSILDEVTLVEDIMYNSYIKKTKNNVDIINTFLKFTTPLKNRIPVALTKRIDDSFKMKKEVLIFDVLQGLKHNKNERGASMRKIKNINPDDVIWTAWFQGVDSLPPVIFKCIDSFNKIKNRKVIVIDKYNYGDYLELPVAIVEKFDKGIISYTAFSEIIRVSLLAEYGGLWLDATIFIDRDISFLIKDKNYVSLRSHNDLSHGNLMGAFPVYFLYSNGHSEGFDEINLYLLTYWQQFDIQVDYFLVDYIFKYVYLNNGIFRKDVDANPILGEKRFLLNDIMSKAYNVLDAKELENNQVPVYKLSNKLKYIEVDGSGKDTFFKKFINGEEFY
ncbi:capsular polysaccharide synthesis protein [Raoultella ornithinolytica]|uniref:capsular polysaccharide synthesis protein n=1 Tax=Raoultella ornithinolytica TaxID=54291 RepID=UPI000675CD43|nr:capsular polysaccharide synthesis protein [Raoultella ornithinolytica]